MIKKKKLSVRETEKIVKSKKTQRITKNTKNKNKDLIQLENSLITYLATKVSIKFNKNKGNLNIHFSNNEDLERIIELILNED